MQRISVHISSDIKQRISRTAKATNKAESEVIREALHAGLNIIAPKRNSAQALLDLAKMAEQLPARHDAPKDVSENHDYYAWGGSKKSEE